MNEMCSKVTALLFIAMLAGAEVHRVQQDNRLNTGSFQSGGSMSNAGGVGASGSGGCMGSARSVSASGRLREWITMAERNFPNQGELFREPLEAMTVNTNFQDPWTFLAKQMVMTRAMPSSMDMLINKLVRSMGAPGIWQVNNLFNRALQASSLHADLDNTVLGKLGRLDTSRPLNLKRLLPFFSQNGALAEVVSVDQKAVESPPKARVVHAVICFAQIVFGASNIVGKLGLNACDPATFALYRQLLGAPLLLAWAWACESSNLLPAPLERRYLSTWVFWAACGVSVFLIQFCFLVGLAWIPSTSAAAWAPSQPIFTACIGIAAGWEKASLRKLGGIGLGFIGGLLLILLGTSDNSRMPVERAGLSDVAVSAIGNSLFFCNCMATALFLIASKRALASGVSGQKPRPVALTAGAYCIALAIMLPVHILVLGSVNVRKLVIAPGSHAPPPSWTVPKGAWPALAYCVIFQSVLGYVGLTWAVRFMDASIVSLYSVLTPVVACTLSTICIAAGYNPNGVLELPGKNLVGAPLVICGLLCVVSGNNTALTRWWHALQRRKRTRHAAAAPHGL